MSPVGFVDARAYNRTAMFRAGRLIAPELAGRSYDPATDLIMTERLALASQLHAVDVEVSDAAASSLARPRPALGRSKS